MQIGVLFHLSRCQRTATAVAPRKAVQKLSRKLKEVLAVANQSAKRTKQRLKVVLHRGIQVDGQPIMAF